MTEKLSLYTRRKAILTAIISLQREQNWHIYHGNERQARICGQARHYFIKELSELEKVEE